MLKTCSQKHLEFACAVSSHSLASQIHTTSGEEHEFYLVYGPTTLNAPELVCSRENAFL